MKFENTALYRMGKYYKELGELMCKPDTELDELVEFADRHGMSLSIRLTPYEPKTEEQEDA